MFQIFNCNRKLETKYLPNFERPNYVIKMSEIWVNQDLSFPLKFD